MQKFEQANNCQLLRTLGGLFGKNYSRTDQLLNLLIFFSVFLSELNPMEYSSWNMIKNSGSLQEIKSF